MPGRERDQALWDRVISIIKSDPALSDGKVAARAGCALMTARRVRETTWPNGKPTVPELIAKASRALQPLPDPIRRMEERLGDPVLDVPWSNLNTDDDIPPGFPTMVEDDLPLRRAEPEDIADLSPPVPDTRTVAVLDDLPRLTLRQALIGLSRAIREAETEGLNPVVLAEGATNPEVTARFLTPMILYLTAYASAIETRRLG